MRCLIPFAAALLTAAAISTPVTAQAVEARTVVLDNGVTAVLVPRATRPRRVTAAWFVPAGHADDPPGQAGLAALVDASVDTDAGYDDSGAISHDTFISPDVTSHLVTLPADQLEVWATIESAFFHPDFFEIWCRDTFDAARDAAALDWQRRRELDPHVVFQTQFEAMFALGGATTGGYPTDLATLTADDARAYRSRHHLPDGLVVVLVGDFEPDVVTPILQRTFGALPTGTPPPPLPRAMPPARLGEMRLAGAVPGPPFVEVVLPTVPRDHPDAAVLEIIARLAGLPSGRLVRDLVEREGLAVDVTVDARHDRRGGRFLFRADARTDAAPERIERAIYRALAILRNEPVADHDLQAVKNHLVMEAFRRVDDDMALARALGVAEAHGDWSEVNARLPQLLAVTDADVLRVAQTYFLPEIRSVAILVRDEGVEVDAELAQYPPHMQAAIRELLGRLLIRENPDELLTVITSLESQITRMPESQRPAMVYVIERLKAHRDAILAREVTP